MFTISTIDFTIIEGFHTVERQRMLAAQSASKTINLVHITGYVGDTAPYLYSDGGGDKEISCAWPHYHPLTPIIDQAAKDVSVTIT